MSETNLNGSIAIAAESDGTTPDPQNTDLSGSAFAALNFVDIPNLGNLGDTGVSQTANSYDTWDQPLVVQQKGTATGNSSEIRVLDVTSNGLTALKAAAAITNQNNYAFRVTYGSGDVEYLRGIVHSKTLPKGGPNAFREFVCTLTLNQEPFQA